MAADDDDDDDSIVVMAATSDIHETNVVTIDRGEKMMNDTRRLWMLLLRTRRCTDAIMQIDKIDRWIKVVLFW